MTEITTYRLSATGAWGYEFYDPERNLIGSVHSVVTPSAPVRIESPGMSWYSQFNIDLPIVPGTGRRIKDSRTGNEVYRIIYWRPGVYELCTKEASTQAEIRNGAYFFGEPLMPVTAMTERISEAEWVPNRKLEVTPCFRTTVFDPVGEAYLMAVLSFPALRMY